MNQDEKLHLEAKAEESSIVGVELEQEKEEDASQDNIQEPSMNENEEAEPEDQIDESEEPEEEIDTATKLLVTKWHKIQEEGDDQDLVINTTRFIKEMVLSWIERNRITGVKVHGEEGEGEHRVEKLED